MKYFLFLLPALLLTFCNKTETETENNVQKGLSMKSAVSQTVDELKAKFPDDAARIERGVSQAAALWNESDGIGGMFKKFCLENFIADKEELDKVFNRVSDNFETIFGHFKIINLELQKPIQLTGYDILGIDKIFAAYSPYAHLNDDFYNDKIAFIIILNFPNYSLNEKMELGDKWSRKEWAYARLGDMFTSRVPAELNQKVNDAFTKADDYISNYNIFVGYLRDSKGRTFFPKDLKLISHWNLRDELKSHYGKKDGLDKQKIIYEVMKRIISQEIPYSVINSDKYYWNPYENKVYDGDKEIEFEPEANTRYAYLLNNFKAVKAIDKYNPVLDTYIKRKFSGEMEIPQEKVEELFVSLVSSPVVREVADLIKSRLGRDLLPFDIWYDGFKNRSTINGEKLDSITEKKYKTPGDFSDDMPEILMKLGFSKDRANFISSRIVVDPSRGAGHASGAEMKSDVSHLRTRIGKNGMDYKGYNIAVHEFGHNVEQTISLNDVDYYMLGGVPNTAFTECWAFVFQKKDLELLGIKDDNPLKEAMHTLDILWSSYEIMGVSLVDMRVWKWLYENPDCNPQQLKEAVIKISKDVWNKYYSDVFGVKDQTILAIYSHMIDYPLYLSAYPIGELIEFQIGEYVKGKNLADEMTRMLRQGKLPPEFWMKGAVGIGLSTEPLINAAKEAINKFD